MSEQDYHCLECPCCGRECFRRPENVFFEDESEDCECGCSLNVELDEHFLSDGVYAYVSASEDCPAWEK